MNQSHITPGILKSLRLLFSGLSLAMFYLIIKTSLQQNMFQVSLQQPWFTTTLIDYYFNVVILIFWVCIKENTMMAKIFWALSFAILGSMGSCFYVFWQLMKVKPGDPWKKFWVNEKYLP